MNFKRTLLEEIKLNYCINCGEKCVETAEFCTNCGTKNPNLVKNRSVIKNKRSPILIGGSALFLIILIFFVFSNSKFSDIAGTWAKVGVPADETRLVFSKDGNLSIIVGSLEGAEISMNYEVEANGKDSYQTSDMSSIQFSIPEDLELINMEDIQDEILDDMFAGIVSDRKVKDGMVIYSMEIDPSNINSEVAELAATTMTIKYLENGLIDLTSVDDSFVETVQLNRIN